LVAFGGHHAAAGVELETERVELLRDRFAQACAEAGVPNAPLGLDADTVLCPGDPAPRVLSDLERFEPCGQGNPTPRVAIEQARVLGKSQLRGGHLRLWVDVGGSPLSCFGFEMAPLADRLGTHANLVGALRRDTWQGGGAAEMRLLVAETV
jgi:single-stranded-DNA-specific exonuclease